MVQQAEVRSISEVVSELHIERIDLIKINIEGGEYDLLPAIIDSGLIKRIKYIQVQFHNFDIGAADARFRIRRSRKTPRMWNYEFVWGKLGTALTLHNCFANFVGDGLQRNNIFDLCDRVTGTDASNLTCC